MIWAQWFMLFWMVFSVILVAVRDSRPRPAKEATEPWVNVVTSMIVLALRVFFLWAAGCFDMILK